MYSTAHRLDWVRARFNSAKYRAPEPGPSALQNKYNDLGRKAYLITYTNIRLQSGL